MKLGNANHDTTYCTNIKCSSKEHCERHKDRWNFKKDENYWFTEFDEADCVRKKCEEYGFKI